MKVLSIDIGYGYLKYTHYDGVNFTNNKFVSGVCEVPTNEFSQSVTSENYHTFQGKRYLIGDLSSKLMIEPLNILEFDQYKLAALVLIDYMLDRFKDNNIDKLVLGLTPALQHELPKFKEYVIANTNFEGDIEVFLQGLSCHHAYYRFGLDSNAKNKDTLEISENYVGIDTGFSTLDFWICINGSLMDFGIRGLMEKGIVIISNNIKKHISENFGVEINDVEAKNILEKYEYKRRGRVTDLSTVIEGYIIEYLITTMDLIEKEYDVQMNRVDNVVFFGGGAHILKDAIERLPKVKEKISELYGDGFLLLPQSNAEYYNSLGYAVQAVS